MTQTTLFQQQTAPPKPIPAKEPKIIGIVDTFVEVRKIADSYSQVIEKTIEFVFNPELNKYVVCEVESARD